MTELDKTHDPTQAMDVYREKLRHPVFLLVTDDVAWVRHNIPQHHFRHFFTGGYNSSLKYLTKKLYNSRYNFYLTFNVLIVYKACQLLISVFRIQARPA